MDIFCQVGFFASNNLCTDRYSSATVMTLDLGIDMGHVETLQSVLPNEPLHDLNVLTLKSTCEIWTFFTTLDFGTKSPSR